MVYTIGMLFFVYHTNNSQRTLESLFGSNARNGELTFYFKQELSMYYSNVISQLKVGSPDFVDKF